MKKNLTICSVAVVLFAIAIFIFKVPANTILVYGAILLCPLMHLFMMDHRGHGEKSAEDHSKH